MSVPVNEHIDGIFVGMLDAEELAYLNFLIEKGAARVVYEGAAGLLGLGKVHLVRAPVSPWTKP